MNQPPPHRNSKCTVLHGIKWQFLYIPIPNAQFYMALNGSSYIYPSNIHNAEPNPGGMGESMGHAPPFGTEKA